MKLTLGVIAVALAAALSGCSSVQPLKWNGVSTAAESEYDAYTKRGTATLSGQAFLTQAGGGVVRAAGRSITLDPATSTGNEWWGKAGKMWVHRDQVPPSPGFVKARRTTVADADGRFKFANLPAGRYYVRTEVTWVIGSYTPTQGGLVYAVVDIEDGEAKEAILNQMPR